MIRPLAPAPVAETAVRTVVSRFRDDPVCAWEELTTAGLLPPHVAAGEANCAFVARSVCRCHGSGIAEDSLLYWRPVFAGLCPRCRRLRAPEPTPLPSTAEDLLALVRTGEAWREAMRLARIFAARLKAFGIAWAARQQNDLGVRYHSEHLEVERVVWRVVAREHWVPRSYLRRPIAPRDRPRRAPRIDATAFGIAIVPFLQRTPLWRRAMRLAEVRLATRANGRRRPLDEWERSLESEFQRDFERARITRPIAYRIAARALRTGRVPHGVALTAASYFEGTTRASRGWASKWSPEEAMPNPFEPLHTLHRLGFAVDDVTSKAILLVAPA